MGTQHATAETTGRSRPGRALGARWTRRAKYLAWTLWGVAIALAAASFTLRVTAPESAHTHGAAALMERLYWFVLIPAAVPAYASVGAAVVARRPGNPVGWLCLCLGLVVVLDDIALEYASHAYVLVPGTLPGGALAAWAAGWLSALTIPPFLFTLLLLVFPNGRLLSPRWRLAAGLALGGGGLAALAVAVAPTRHLIGGTVIRNPGMVADLAHAAAAARTAGNVIGQVALLAAGLAAVLRWRRSVGRERQQLKWLAYMAGVTTAAILMALAVPGRWPYIDVLVGAVPIACVALGIPAAIGVAMLRHHLYDIDLIIRRTLVYGPLTGTLAGLYWLGVVGMQQVVGGLTGLQGSPLASVASTLAIAALFQPLRRRLQAQVDRRFYRHKYDAAQTLAAFSATLRDETDLERISADLLAVVEETMQPAHVSLWLRPVEGRRPAPERPPSLDLR